MISVLIPVFNTDVRQLVHALSAQMQETGTAGEILVLDDGSTEWKPENSTIAKLPFVKYQENSENAGRVAIRQKLAVMAQYDLLLFLDGDSEVTKPQFIAAYMAQTGTSSIVAGGRKYTKAAPADCRFRLHWKYGTQREAHYPSRAFHSNNFLIRKDIFKQISFPHWLQGYGHEDTWMGIQFEVARVPVTYIDNPVLHCQLDDSAAYLTKTTEALENLVCMQAHLPPCVLGRHVRLYHWALLLRDFRFSVAVTFLLQAFRRLIERNLRSCNPSLFLFDLFRLQQLLHRLRVARQSKDGDRN